MTVKTDKQRARGQSRSTKAPTMASVGRLAGVSQVTVSRALSDPTKVSADTLQRINDAIKLTGFVPNALAGALASQRSMMISALVPSITNPVYATMLAPFSAELRAQGYQVLLSETGFDPKDVFSAVQKHLSKRPDALLLTGVEHPAETRRTLLAAGIPIVEVWDITRTPIDQAVGFSHSSAGWTVADFAFENNYRYAACISASDARAMVRMRAFSERFEARGGSIVAPITHQDGFGIAAGRAMLRRLLDKTRGFHPLLIFCSCDSLAHGVMIEAQSRGLSIPQQIAIIGFGDLDFSAHLEPALTTVQIDRNALGREAAQAILSRLAGQQRDNYVIDIGFNMCERAST